MIIRASYAEVASLQGNRAFENTPPLRVGVINNDFFPFLIRINQNEYIGYTLDWWGLWSKATSKPIQFVYLSEKEAVTALISKKIDVIDLSLKQEQPSDFSVQTYQSLDISLYAFDGKRDLSDLSQVSVGFIETGLCSAYLKSITNNTYAFANYLSLINGLTSQRVDTICLDSASTSNLINKFQLQKKLFQSAPLNIVKLSRVYLQSETDKLKYVESGALNIKNNDLEELNRKWLGKNTFNELKLPVSMPLILGLSGIFVVCLFVIVELRSRYKAASKTLQLTLKKREQDLEIIEEKHAYIKSIIELWPELVFEMNDDQRKIRIINERSFDGYSKKDFKQQFELLLTEKQPYFQGVVDKLTRHSMYKVAAIDVDIANSRFIFEMVFVKKSDPFDRYPILVFARDRTKKLVAELEQKLSATFFGNSHDAMCITDPFGLVVKVNEAFSKITGYSQTEVVGQNMHILSSGKHGKAFFTSLWNELKTTGSWQGEIWNKKKNGDLYLEWLTISTVYNEEGEPQYRTAIFIDITKLRQAEEKLFQQANFDSITNLPNRFNFSEAMESRVISAASDRSQFCLYFIDLDHFKEVNDTLGHNIGDRLLHEATSPQFSVAL